MRCPKVTFERHWIPITQTCRCCLVRHPLYNHEVGELDNIGVAVKMTFFRHHHRLCWILLLAISGTLLLSSDVPAACVAKVGPSCCSKPDRSLCCCVPPSHSSRPAPSERSLGLAPHGASLDFPAGRCECRPGEQPAPALRSETHRQKSQSDIDWSEPIGSRDAAFPLTASRTTFVREPAGPSKSPLYLRTARLLI
jgi:hypothetical protein